MFILFFLSPFGTWGLHKDWIFFFWVKWLDDSGGIGLVLAKQDGRWVSSASLGETFSCVSSWGPERWQKGPIQREGHIHRHLPLHLLGVQSAPSVWHSLHNGGGSVLLDACHPCLEPWNCYGARNHTHCDIRTCDAASCWFKDHWSGQQCPWGSRPLVRIFPN